jgi:hypothetical protein
LGNIGKKFPAVLWSGALGVGFFMGVASYQQNCFDQIMKLENSKLAEQVRAYQRMKRDDVPVDFSPNSSPLEEHLYVSTSNSQDEFCTSPLDKVEDYYEEGGVSDKAANDAGAKHRTSFDEIRAYHRRLQQEQQAESVHPENMQPPSRHPIQHDKPSRDQRLKSKSKYGDVGWE